MNKIIGLNGQDIVDILQLGLSGLAFLFVLMCFYLLRSEQIRSSGPRDKILHAIERFRRSCLIFAVVVGVFGILGLFIKPSSNNENVSQVCHDAIERVITLSQSPKHDTESLRQLIRNGLTPCLESLRLNESSKQ